VEKHIFDSSNRIPADEVEQLALHNWAPPTIDEAGHLVYAKPRDIGRRDMTGMDASTGTAGETAEDAQEMGRQQGLKLGREEGFAQGKVEGLEAGKKEGLKLGQEAAAAQAKQALDEKLGEMNKLLTSISHNLNEEDYKLEQAILNLIQAICEAVVKKELLADPGQLMKIIKEVIAALPPNRDNVKIRLNPKDKALVDSAINLGGENWHAVADEEITPGGCIVQTDQSIVDYTTEVRFKSAVEQIVDGHLHYPSLADEDFEEADEPLVAKASEEETPQEPDFETQAQALEAEGVGAADPPPVQPADSADSADSVDPADKEVDEAKEAASQSSAAEPAAKDTADPAVKEESSP